jgi:transcriptional regulator with PAS, ATPase and Fis domain
VVRHLKTYEGIFDFLKKKDKNEPEKTQESPKSSKPKELPLVDYDKYIEESLSILKSSGYQSSNLKKESIEGITTWTFDVQVKDELAIVTVKLLKDSMDFEIKYKDFDVKHNTKTPITTGSYNRFSGYGLSIYKIEDLVSSTEAELFKSKWSLETIKEYFQEVSDLVDGRIKYEVINDKSETAWYIQVFFSKDVNKKMDDVIKEQELSLSILKLFKGISIRLSHEGMNFEFRRDDSRIYQNERWKSFIVTLSSGHSSDYDEYDEDGYDEEYYDEDGYDEEED